MKLTTKHKELLKEYGYLEEDFKQIQQAIYKTTFSKYKGLKEVEISLNDTIKELGEEEFLSGISRSAFHWSSVRNGIYFDSSALFKEVEK